MPRRAPRLIDPHVLAELAQFGPEGTRGVLRYAAQRVRMLSDAGCPVANDEAEIIVADAIADTLTGVVTWDPRYPLSYHLCSVVRTRSSNQLKQARRRGYTSLEAAHDRDALEPLEDHQAPSRPDVLVERALVTEQLYRSVRRQAVRDSLVIALLDAYMIGCVQPHDVMKLTGMTRADFLNARRRLDRMLMQLPPSLRRAAFDVLRG